MHLFEQFLDSISRDKHGREEPSGAEAVVVVETFWFGFCLSRKGIEP